ncbi:IDEAL domain-containing protein [Robertmurraya yapensis]|uniref:IDEAL domain-containing protein n=2 Tax=Bacillaceae TaxID=186817 RepID=A0A431VV65_9BACI|nr:IDEAL domain-containing protein [Bacillus yapensis]RTR27147.1 IDEAL domain-containing protein [Bacillus yapensis]TKS93994.1 IDEAL domain-containing protein [Bacillus yapensis]
MNKDLLKLPEPTVAEQLSVLAEQILNESLLEYRKEKLRKEIDQSLLERDKDEFLRLSSELNSIS